MIETPLVSKARPLRFPELTRPVKIAIGAIAVLIVALAVLGGMGSFTTVRELAVPWFGWMSWIVPVGIDVGILALLAWDLVAEYLGSPWPVLRWVAWAFIGGTIYLNIAGAHGNPKAAVMHMAMPVLFVVVIEGIRHLIRHWAGLTAGTRIEPIPLSRWLLAPVSSLLLARRMILWQITSYREALALEYQRLEAVAILQESYGRYLWRWKAPLSDRLALRLAFSGPVDQSVPDEEPKQSEDRDKVLVQKAGEILRDAEREGIHLSQMALARKLRAQGHAIANDRLGWLVSAVNDESDREAAA